MKKLYLISLFSIFIFLLSCQKQLETIDEQQPIQMNGSMTRAGNTPIAPTVQYSIFVSAKYLGTPYLVNVPSTMASTTGNITFSNGPWYYPLGNANLSFYAFTPSANASDVMTLTSGSALANDALLSNNGGTGTIGSPVSPVQQLVFSHLMTKLDVEVVSDDHHLDPLPTSVKVRFSGVTLNGNYNINWIYGAFSTANSGNYDIVLGTNYLVPTGAKLSKHFLSLTIDNYVATAADLATYQITASGGGGATDITLASGQAYKLTLKMKRLQLDSVQLSMGNWNTINLSNDAITNVSKQITLNLGAYVANDITKIEVVDTDNKLFTGSVVSGVASFVLAPTTLSRVKLFTAKGLLIESSVASLSAGTIDFSKINKFGMLPINPSLNYDAVTNRYAVFTVEQFKKITTSGYNYIQTANIDFKNESISSVLMDGSYDGNGFQLKGVNILGLGLFKEVAAGQTVQNVRITSGCVIQNGLEGYVGAICGKNSGSLVACINHVSVVTSLNKYIGGICGENAGTIIGCLNSGNITGVYAASVYTGGICGYNSNGGVALSACVNLGMITATGIYRVGVLGAICGYSVSGGVFSTSYWLTGTAAPTIGSAQVAVNGSGVTLSDLSDLSPQLMRDPLILTNLNGAMLAGWGTTYKFILSSSVWPMPVKII